MTKPKTNEVTDGDLLAAANTLTKMLDKKRRDKRNTLIARFIVGIMMWFFTPIFIIDLLHNPDSYWNWFWVIVTVPSLFARARDDD
jgi:hypothetical protein